MQVYLCSLSGKNQEEVFEELPPKEFIVTLNNSGKIFV
jgi:hypothetical protein